MTLKFKKLTEKDIVIGFLGEDSFEEKKTLKDILDTFQKYSSKDTPIILHREEETIDFHRLTIEEAWDLFNEYISHNIRYLNVITGASGILKKDFIKWLDNPKISNRIISWKLINNGCYKLELHRIKTK